MYHLLVNSDMSEKVDYNIPDFPLYVSDGRIQEYDKYAQQCHWHVDLEFILVLEGSMEYSVNGRSHHVGAGEGLFINSKRLHYGYSADKSDCLYLVIVVHPSLLGAHTNFGEEYFTERFGSGAEDYILLADERDWQREALQSIKTLYDETLKDEKNPIRMISLFTSLCSLIGEHIKTSDLPSSTTHEWKTVQQMTGYIQGNYDKTISLDDIATAGSTCRCKCCKLFNEHIGKTPKAYLTQYRISKSVSLLRDTDISIIEIAQACGFNNQSYFTQAFRKELGVPPRKYRDNFRQRMLHASS